MRWLTRQLYQNSSGAFRFSDGFNFLHLSHAPINADVLVSKVGNEYIELVATGSKLSLLFHTHAWCGAVYVTVNGVEQMLSLYSEEHEFKSIEIVALDLRPMHIIIRSGTPPDPRSRGNEVWLVAVDFDEPQSWQPLSLPISPYCSITRGQHGTFVTLATDSIIGASIVRTGIWAPKDVELFQSLIQPGMTVLDIGANIGHHTTLYSTLVGRTGRVIAFEPQSVIFRLLAANAVINGCENTELIQSCVGESEGFVHMYPVNYAAPTNFGALGVDPKSEIRGEEKGERCRIATVDRLLSELSKPLTRCDFVKIDVQSYELFVLKGARNILTIFRPVLFLEISPHWMSKSYDYREIYYYLWDMGYEIEHPADPSVEHGTIKEWSGIESEEWDIVARPKRNTMEN